MHPTTPMLLILATLSGPVTMLAEVPWPPRSTAAQPFTAEELDCLAADYRQRAEESRRKAADLRKAEAREIGQTPLLSKAPYHPWLRGIRERYAALIREAERQADEAGATATYFANRALERRLEEGRRD